MKLSIHELRHEIEAYLSSFNTLQYRFGAGLSTEVAAEELDARFPELFRTDTFREVSLLAKSPFATSEEGARHPILEFLADRVEEAMAREAMAAVAALEFEGTPVPAAVEQLKDQVSRPRRQELERALGDLLWEHQEDYGRRTDAAVEAAKSLGYPNYLALRESVSGLRFEALSNECEGLLKETEDAYRDLLTYVLKHVEPALRPFPQGEAQQHDLARGLTAPWLMEHFRREELLAAVTRSLSEMGLAPHAEGRILLDSEEREGKKPDPFAVALKVPQDVRLVLLPKGGLQTVAGLLHQYGLAQQLANTSSSASLEERWLAEGGMLEGFALLFDHFLLDPAWHRRYLRLPERAAHDAAHLAAFNQLAILRACCAELPLDLSLYARGAVRPLADEYQERMSLALGVNVNRSMYLFNVRPFLGVGRNLLGHALEAPLHRLLQERFNEDYWRNPAAGRWLKDLFARPTVDISAASEKFGLRETPLSGASARLVKTLDL